MAENKTKPTGDSVTDFLNKIQDKQVREDCFAISAMMQKATNAEPVMWGSAIVGFGNHHYVYPSGREGDTVLIGFSPRKQAITLYFMGGVNSVQEELSRLGKFKTGKGCLYIKTLGDVNADVLGEILVKACQEARRIATSAA